MTKRFEDKWAEMHMKHLEFVQNAISRMSSHSATLKGFCMMMVAAIIGLSAAISKGGILLYIIPVLLMFTVLDSVYLSLEKGFREQYEELRVSNVDTQPSFEIRSSYNSIVLNFFSWSVLGFYGSITIILIGLCFGMG